MVQPTRPPANGFVAVARKVYNPLGFAKGYNFVLFFIFFGALMGFTLARFQYLSFSIFCGEDGAAPGECYYYRQSTEKIGIIVHLAAILPASFLACLQFIPVIRHKALMVHRVNGYAVVLLSLVGTGSIFMFLRNAFGGGLDTQAAVGLVSMLFIGSMVLAWINIKRLQIEQHRAWMLRAWFYVSASAPSPGPLADLSTLISEALLTKTFYAQAGCIVTMRLIQYIAAIIISMIGTYYTARPCAQVADMVEDANRTLELYPECATFFSGENPGQQVVVHADLTSPSSAAEAGAAAGMAFGMAIWLAFALHAIGVEVYVSLLLFLWPFPAHSSRCVE